MGVEYSVLLPWNSGVRVWAVVFSIALPPTAISNADSTLETASVLAGWVLPLSLSTSASMPSLSAVGSVASVAGSVAASIGSLASVASVASVVSVSSVASVSSVTSVASEEASVVSSVASAESVSFTTGSVGSVVSVAKTPTGITPISITNANRKLNNRFFMFEKTSLHFAICNRPFGRETGSTGLCRKAQCVSVGSSIGKARRIYLHRICGYPRFPMPLRSRGAASGLSNCPDEAASGSLFLVCARGITQAISNKVRCVVFLFGFSAFAGLFVFWQLSFPDKQSFAVQFPLYIG